MKALIGLREERLWLEYDKELSLYAGARTREEALAGLKSYEERDDCYYIPVCEEGEPVGFIIIGIGESCHPACDYHMAEAYIQSGHRRKGIMSNKVGEFLKEHPGRYSMDIFDKNIGSKKFWEETFRRSGYRSIDLPYIEHGMDRSISDLYFFEKGK